MRLHDLRCKEAPVQKVAMTDSQTHFELELTLKLRLT